MDVALAAQVLLNYDQKYTGGSCQGGDHYTAAHFFYKYGATDDTCAPFLGVDLAWGIECCGRDAPTERDFVTQHLCRTCDWNGTCAWKPPPQYRLYRAEAFGRSLGEHEMLAEIYARGPIACSMYACSETFEQYSGGILEDVPNRGKNDHVVVIAGFGKDWWTGKKFWVGRNSYGTGWGEGPGGGWFRLRRGVDALGIESGGCSWAVPSREDVARFQKWWYPKPSWKDLRSTQSDRRAKKRVGELPQNFDWRNVNGQNFGTRVLTQFSPRICHSCWAHGPLGAISDRYRIATNGSIDVSLSIQALLNHDSEITGGNCQDGNTRMVNKFLYTYGVSDDTCAPYMGQSFAWGIECCANTVEMKVNKTSSKVREHLCQSCSWNGNCVWVPPGRYQLYRVGSYGTVKGENAMLREIYERGPIACDLDSIPAPFDNHSGGVIIDHDNATNTTDHVVVITGFGVDEETGMKFWSGRNSWGTSYGEDGFFRIRRGTDTLQLESEPCYWAVPLKEDVSRLMSGYQPVHSEWPPHDTWGRSRSASRDSANQEL
eukprot:gnl/TRDRNA2_/TRDRNA2_171632_c1_seq1.p1 gnl/TRDRNA2_/TRDRNA2_171632_c1~~gnl/TRDRNA2_/TRDRNA2_171632_c1_seq1.p1  ORF type:complete len:553 (+),score=34.82 gnl/TRDRNA2_/TRDRNA2_171632_c1_seq1:30-1661(+)